MVANQFQWRSFSARLCILVTLAAAVVSGCGPAAAVAPPGITAPAFELRDTNGKTHRLSDYRGKVVVLEWLNHGCPYVRGHYDLGNMQSLQRDLTAKGVVWLSVNSSAPGKQGHYPPEEANQLTKVKTAAPTAVLLDGDGKVGRSYGAKTTPHMFVIDGTGKVVYNGAIDDNTTARKTIKDIQSARNFVRLAVGSVLAGRPVETPSTKPYGCSVKYK